MWWSVDSVDSVDSHNRQWRQLGSTTNTTTGHGYRNTQECIGRNR
jgi:hypothetical protein